MVNESLNGECFLAAIVGELLRASAHRGDGYNFNRITTARIVRKCAENSLKIVAARRTGLDAKLKHLRLAAERAQAQYDMDYLVGDVP